MFDSYIATVPIVCVVLGGLAATVAEAFRQPNERMPIGGLAIVGLLAAAVAAVLLWDRRAESFGVVSADKFGLFVTLVLVIVGILTVAVSSQVVERDGLPQGEYYALTMFAIAGMMLMAVATDLLVMFIALEILSVSLYVLIGIRRNVRTSAEAAFKYFLLGAFSSAFFLYGVAFTFGIAGSTRLDRIGIAMSGQTLSYGPLTHLALALLLVGFAFKVSAVPFHMWTPDAYEGAPTPTTAFMAVVVKSAAFAVMARVLIVAFPLGSPLSAAPAGWVSILTGLAILTMVLGNFAGLMQDNVKRLLAYSSIAHAGYILVGIVAAGAIRAETPLEADLFRADALGAVLYYLLGYTLATAGAFAVVSVCARRHREVARVADLNGFARRSPGLAFAFLLCILSLLGVPPTAGFFGKLYLFKLAVGAGLWPLAVIGVLTSVAAAYYYLRLLVAVYMRDAESDDCATAVVTVRGRLGIAVAAVSLVVVGLLPSRFLSVATQSVFDLFRM